MKKIFFAGLLCALFAACGMPSDSTNSSPLGITNTKVSRENYEKIQKGMAIAEVQTMMGKPDTVSESDTPGLGVMKLHHYQLGMKAIDVYFLNGKVYMKNWTEL